jgi:hypothetical protein
MTQIYHQGELYWRRSKKGESSMLKTFSQACCLVGVVSLGAFVANAQEVVHALAGTVSSMNPTEQTITIKTDDGSEGLFKDLMKSNVSFDFDKNVRAASIPASSFTRKGAHVIVYYFGGGDVRTAVALQELGVGPLQKISGSVYKFNKHEHLLTIKDAAGLSESFHIDPKTVAETSWGAVEGEKFNPEKGDQVRVTAVLANGAEDALFIREN